MIVAMGIISLLWNLVSLGVAISNRGHGDRVQAKAACTAPFIGVVLWSVALYLYFYQGWPA